MAPAERIEQRHTVIPYAPRKQFLPYHARQQRWSVIVAHRRAGKTVACINDLIKAAMECTKTEPRFAYIAPLFTQAKDVAWSYLKRYGLVIPGSQANESELRLDLPNGARVRLYGADNYDRMRGIYLDGLVNDEYGDQDPRAWTEVLRPALSDRMGWATFIGTPRGQNHFADLWNEAQTNDDWFKLMLKASLTNIVPESELASARQQMTPEQYAAEYECSFYGSVVGAYYGREVEYLESLGYVGSYGWEPSIAVNTAWDTGGTTAIWFFQNVGNEIRIIDFIEGHNQSAPWYVGKLRERPYTYGTHILPWDAGVEKEIVGISWQDALAKLQLFNTHILPQQGDVNNGINTARLLLPKCRFNKDTTADGLKCLRNYRREWDDKRKVFREHPLHDWASHGSDAFRYLALGIDAVSIASAWGKPLEYKQRVI